MFLIPYFFGTTLIAGDDLIQNYPLRVLSGDLIKSGHLPYWDNYIWSGSPLLGGFNAGALYPGTLLFAFISPPLAWSINYAIAYWMGASGIYFFLRKLLISRFAGFFAGLSFAALGSMSAQYSHIDLVQAMGFAPWVLLSFDALILSVSKGLPKSQDFKSFRLSPGALAAFSATMALLVLTGSTRGITCVLIILLARSFFYLEPVKRLAVLSRHSARFAKDTFYGASDLLKGACWVALGLLLAFALSSLQIIPGLEYIRSSQRGQITPQLFSQYSLPMGWLSLSFFPSALGTSSSFHSPLFFGWSFVDLQESASYLGILAIAGCVGIFFNRRKLAANLKSEVSCWFSLIIAGYLLSFAGSINFLTDILYKIPIYGGERLQGRNLLETDFAVSICFGVFLEYILDRSKRNSNRLEISSVICYGCFIIGGIFTLWPALPIDIFIPGSQSSYGASGLRFWNLSFAFIALFGALIIQFRKKLSKSWLPIAIAILCCMDIVAYNVTVNLTIERSGSGTTTVTKQVVEMGHTKPVDPSAGRFAMYDPGLYGANILALGWPDTNSFQGKLSVQGYSSLSPGDYDLQTQTHGNLTMNPQDLTDGVFFPLDVTTFYAERSYFATSIATATSASPSNPATPTSLDSATPTWFFDPTFTLSDFQVPRIGSAKLSGGLILPDGKVMPILASEITQGPTYIEVKLENPIHAAGIYFEGSWTSTGVQMNGAKILVAGQSDWNYLNGPIEDFVKPPDWKYSGLDGDYLVFKRPGNGLLTVIGKGASVDSKTLKIDIAGNLTSEVNSPNGAELIRSETFYSGWHVHIVSMTNGEVKDLVVHQFGLIQEVTLPKGDWSVTFNYVPTSANFAYLLECIGLICLCLLLCFQIFGNLGVKFKKQRSKR